MVILVLNCGSSSIKYQVIDMEAASSKLLAKGIVERIGLPEGDLTHKPVGKEPFELHRPIPDHTTGIKLVLDALTDPAHGVIGSLDEVKAVGHRVAHGGEFFPESCIVTEEVKSKIRSLFEIAPLHNPANLMGIDVAEKLFPGVPNVGVFDTEFGMTLAPEAYLYPLPYSLYEELRIRRYGFHGTSHKYIAKATAAFLGKPLSELNSITMHLGNGSSMSAVQNGKCIDTSMGLTPLEGLMMGTRCGSIDPAIVPFMMEKKGMTPQEADTVLNKQSGLLGICGTSDMRDVHANIEKGDEKAALAFKMLTRSIKKVLGSYFFLLGNVDSIVFTAGIGENDEFVREAVCEGLEPFGIKVDKKENHTRKPGARVISTPDSRIPVLIIPTNEELEIATTTMRIVEESQK